MKRRAAENMELVRVNGKTTTEGFNAELNTLMQDVFGFSFARFQALGVWDEEYEYFSVCEAGRMIANCGVHHMQMLVEGQRLHYLQFGAVAVHPDYRGQGLGRLVMESALDAYPDVPSFLYANTDAVPFYEKLGFVTQEQRQPYVTVLPEPRHPGLERLEVIYPEVDAYLASRGSFSPHLDCLNQYALNWFHLVYMHQDHIYHVPALQAMLVMEEGAGEIVLHDVISQSPIAMDDLLPFVQSENVERITFGFCPARLGCSYEAEPYHEPGTTFMVRGCPPFSCFIPRLVRT